MQQQRNKEKQKEVKLPNLKRKRSLSITLESKRNKFVKKISKINKDFRKRNHMEKDIKHDEFTSEETLTIFPNEIIFKDIIPGQIYQMKAKVKNLSKVVRRIRVFQPKSPEFRCDYEMVTAIAPGLAIDLIISFEATERGEYNDEIKVISGNYEKTIPMLAYSPMAKIIFEPFINLGFIQVGSVKKETVLFKNEGAEKGIVTLKPDGGGESLSIEPSRNFELEPGEVKNITLVFKAEESGLFRGVVEVSTKGKTFLNTIDINATCVEYNQFIIDDNGKELPIIEFGEVIFGQKKKLGGYLVNNSPEGLFFKVNFLQGHFDMYEEENNILSPHEVGHEQTMRVLSMEPRSGFIESYSQIPVNFLCKTEVNEDHKIWTKNNCLAKGELKNKMILKDYEYSSVYFFSRRPNSSNEESMTKVVKMKATGVCPLIKFSENTLIFEKCPMGSFVEKQVTLYNDSSNSVWAEGPNVSQFHTKPRKLRLAPGDSKRVTIRYMPKNLGKAKIKGKFVINGHYECMINLEGNAAPKLKNESKKRNAMSLRSLGSRGKLESGLSLREKRKLLEKNILGKRKKALHQFEGKGLVHSKSTANGFMRKKRFLPKMGKTNNALKSGSLYNVKPSKLGYTTGDAFKSNFNSKNRNLSQKKIRNQVDYLRESRINRAKLKKDHALKRQMTNLKTQIKAKIPDYYNQSKPKKNLTNTQASDNTISQTDLGLNSKRNKDMPAHMMEEDMKFMFNPNYDGLDSPRMNYPEEEKYLFVTKPIGKYLPLESAINMMFDPDPNLEVKPLPSKPFGHTVTRDINRRLDGEMLKHIHAGPKVLEYGNIFVNSSMDKYFFVRNSLKNAIVVRVQLDEDEITESYEKPQIILSGQSAGFKVRFKSSELGYISKVIKYLINDHHEFKFMIKATVTRVQLLLSRKKIDITFPEDNLGLEASETIHLTNKGNADAKFKWYSPNPSFTFFPDEDIVKPGTSVPIKVFYKPNGRKLYEEDIMDLMIEDGETMTMQVTGGVDESKCEAEPKILDFGSLAVGETSELNLELENTHSRNSCIYFVDEKSIPPCLKFSKKNGKIYPQSVDKIAVTFQSNQPEQFSGKIKIMIRGNKSMVVPFTAGVIVPKIVVYEPDFDFGKITYGNSRTMEINIENTSPIMAKLKIDFRGMDQMEPENHGAECLTIDQIREKEEDSFIIEEVEAEYLKMLEKSQKEMNNMKEFENMKIQQKEEDLDSLLSRDSDSEENTLDLLHEEDKKVKFYILTMKPNKVYKFSLTFQPKRTQDYDFFLPFYTGNSKEFNGEIQKRVVCSSVPPKILMEPIDGVRDFKKIIISHTDRNLPRKKVLKIKNPDPYISLSFFIKSDVLEEDRVFFLSKNEGTVLPGESLEIMVTFNPHIQGNWDYSLPLFLDDDRDNKKGEIILKGQAANPKLYFDRRQVILPVVPLNITSRSVFRIINDGFQNVTITGEVREDYSKLVTPLNLKFLDGISMNLRKKVLKVEVSFKSKIPISFTVKLDFKDAIGETWTINCSGTSDNCLLTNCFYFMRNLEEEGEINREAGYSVIYKPKFPSDDASEDSNRIVRSAAAVSKMSLNSAEGNLGYSPIPYDILQKYCRTLSFWLSETVPHIGVNAFPDDIIFNNGKQLLDLLQFLTKKSYGTVLKFKPAEKQSERAPQLYEFYSELVSKLMEQGAYLCDIRPEFLLNYQELMYYIKNNEVKNSHRVTLKLNETQFKYISCFSWCVLINQIIKLFYLSRVNTSKIRSMRGLTRDQKKIDKRFLASSNVYSQSELILLRWSEISLQTIKNQKGRQLYLFDKHFKNGIAFACILQHFSDNLTRPLTSMRDIAMNEHDCRVNMGAVKHACQDLGLTGVPTLETLVNLNRVQSLLFLCNLFQVMPFYMPKELIKFECVLNDHIVKKITISNPTSYKMAYMPVLSGSNDFEINNESILIEPKSKRYEFPVKFYARLTRPVMARLCFKGLSGDGKVQAAPIVYDLISKVEKRRSIGREEINDVQLYHSSQRMIYIDNPFEADAEFTVTIEYLKSVKQTPKGYGGYETQQAGYTSRRKNRDKGLSIPCFFLQNQKVFVKRGKKGKIRFHYIPVTFEVHMCHVIFTDNQVGELQYDLIGTPLLPGPLQIFTYQTSLDDHDGHNLLLSMGYKAKTDAYDKMSMHARRIRDSRMREFTLEFLDKSKESDIFNIDLASAAKEIHLPNEFRMYDVTTLMEKDEEKLNKLNIKGDINNLPLGLSFRNPVQNYSCMFLMRNQDYTDVRIYEVIITVLPKVFKAKLEFSTSARLPITQKIPVLNGTKGEINFEVSKIDVQNGKFFLIDKSLNVKRESTGYLSVTYRPEWLEESEAVIVIKNPLTQEKFEYSLKGKSDEPLAEDHLKFKCDVGEEKRHTIPFKNPTMVNMNYTVEYDLHSISGLKSFKLKSGKSHQYELTIKPNLGGIYAGMITFTDQRGHYWWYTMELESKGKRNVREYDVSGEIRKETTLEIPVQNNHNEKIEYSVIVRGRYIYGPSRFKVKSLSKDFYKLRFLPLEPGVIEENTVTFANPKSGEIFCVVKTTGRDRPSEKLPVFKAEIGKDFSRKVILGNPSGMTVKVESAISNPDNFKVDPKKFEILPYSNFSPVITYIPNQIDIQNKCDITFKSKEIGDWKYTAFGKGENPTDFKERTITAFLRKEGSTVITFTNPFMTSIILHIDLIVDRPTIEQVKRNGGVTPANPFKLHVQKEKVTLQAGKTFQIPISFIPQQITEYRCKLILKLNEKISWIFPIKLVTEASVNEKELHVSTICRKKKEKKFIVELEGVKKIFDDDEFDIELDGLKGRKRKLDIFSKWFKVVDYFASEGTENVLTFIVKFHPQKPFKEIGMLKISRKRGGIWRFKIKLESAEPPVLDKIVIESPLNVTSTAQFKLTNGNNVKQGSPFTSEFSHESASEFNVYPKKGILQPMAKNGTMFNVTFTPVEYGKMKIGKLIIQTETKYWSFRVEGTFPKYEPPVIKKISNLSNIRVKHDHEEDKHKKSTLRLKKKMREKML